MKWTKCAIRFLRISRPGVRVPSIAPRKTSTHCVLVFLFVCMMEGARTGRRRIAPQAISPVGCCLELRVAAPSIRLVPWVALASCWPLPQQLLLASATGRSRRCCRFQWLGMSTVEAVDRKISWLFCFVSHGCTVSARSVLSMSDDVGRCIALQSVPFFASGEQCQAKFCLHFRFEGFFLDLAWIEPPFSPRATAGQPPAEGRQFTLGTFGKAGIIPVSLHLADPHIGQSGLKDIARLAVLHAAAASGAGSRQIVPCGTICPHQGGQRQGSVPEERALLPLPEAESGQRARPRRHGQDFAVGGGAPAYGC